MKFIIDLLVSAFMRWLVVWAQRQINKAVEKREKKAEQKAKDEAQIEELKKAKTNEERIKAADKILNNR